MLGLGIKHFQVGAGDITPVKSLCLVLIELYHFFFTTGRSSGH